MYAESAASSPVTLRMLTRSQSVRSRYAAISGTPRHPVTQGSHGAIDFPLRPAAVRHCHVRVGTRRSLLPHARPERAAPARFARPLAAWGGTGRVYSPEG